MTSSLHRLDLNQLGMEILSTERILHRNRRIHEVDVSPFTGTLYWIEVNRHGAGHLMRSRLDGTSLHPLFAVNIDSNRKQCTCPENPRVGRTFTLDQTDPYHPKVIYSDDLQGVIYQTGSEGCHCSILLKNHGKAVPSSLTTDHHFLFWSNETEGKIYMADGGNIVELDEPSVNRIRSIASHLQPLPEKHCLIIESLVEDPHVMEITSRSIVLELPSPVSLPDCLNISKSTPRYTVYYGIINDGFSECTDNLRNCEKIETYHRTLEISRLKPFSSYVVRVTVTNYYNVEKGIKEVVAPLIVVKTSAGAPSKPREVSAKVITPNFIQVHWQPPLEFNDQAVWYEVHWKTEGFVSGMRQSGEFVVGISDTLDNIENSTKIAQVHKLIPGQLYQVWVRVYSQNSEYFTDSEPVELSTYPLPGNITLAQATPYSLEVFWSPPLETAKYSTIQFYDFNFGDWQNVTRIVSDVSFTRYFLEDLTPKTSYLFRTCSVYENADKPFIWPLDSRFNFETLGKFFLLRA